MVGVKRGVLTDSPPNVSKIVGMRLRLIWTFVLSEVHVRMSYVQVLEERVQHVDSSLSAPEEYYQPTGREVQPKPVGEEAGQVVFQYYPVSAVNYVSALCT